MQRRGHVSYPKKRKKIQLIIKGAAEPVRKSMYDIVLENFKRVNRVTYLHRVIYVGEHFFKKDQKDALVDFISSTVSKVNEDHHLERLTGFLLVYAKYIVHLVEGNESSLYNHLNHFLENEEYKEYVGTVKLLIHVSHIRQRFVESWKIYHGTPSKLLTEIDINSDLENSGRIIFNTIKKIYNLVLTFDDDDATDPDMSMTAVRDDAHFDSESTSTMASSRILKNDFRVSNVSLRTMQPIGLDPYRTTLPENEILNFIILTQYTMDLRKYRSIYYLVPQREIYKDKVWPVPGDFVPYDIFSKPFDCITDLPRTDKKVEEEKKEEEEPLDEIEEAP